MRTPQQIIGHDAFVQLAFEGYAVVPIQPGPCTGNSDGMLFAFVMELHASLNDGFGPSGWHDFSDEQRERLRRAYRAMIEAASSPPCD